MSPSKKKYVQLNVTLLGSRVLVTRIKVQVKMKSSRSRQALNPVGHGVLVRGDTGQVQAEGRMSCEDTDTEGGRPGRDRGGDESHAASSHGTPRAPRRRRRQESLRREPGPANSWILLLFNHLGCFNPPACGTLFGNPRKLIRGALSFQHCLMCREMQKHS